MNVIKFVCREIILLISFQPLINLISFLNMWAIVC